MKIVIAPDSFKGSLTSRQAAQAIQQGISSVEKNIETVLVPIADGGEGTVECLVESTRGLYQHAKVKNPLNRDIKAVYGILGNDKIAVIEMSAASGITLLPEKERNPLVATSYGTGQLIKDALDKGCRKFIIGLGGSATNDAGAGMLQAIGVNLLNNEGNEIEFGGAGLSELVKIDLTNIDSRILESEFLVASDVVNPLCGENGASYIYGPQKGADQNMVKQLDGNLEHFAKLIKQQVDKDIINLPGAGAAGGMGSALIAFLNGKLTNGIDLVLEYSQFENKIKDADLIVTGEGKVDLQTLNGKALFGITKIANKYNVPIIAIAGTVENKIDLLNRNLFMNIYSLTSDKVSLTSAIKNASVLLEKTAKEVITDFIKPN